MAAKGMAASQPTNLSRERLERDAYVVLLHGHTQTAGDPRQQLVVEQLLHDLALSDGDGACLVYYLMLGGFVDYLLGRELSLTSAGVGYIERVARRRRSVRLPPSLVAGWGFPSAEPIARRSGGGALGRLEAPATGVWQPSSGAVYGLSRRQRMR